MAEHEDAVEETVMLTRRGRRSQRADAEAPAVPPAADTAESAVDTAAGTLEEQGEDQIEDRTVVVERSRDAGIEDRTVVVERSRDAEIEDHTVVVERTREAAPPAGPAEIEQIADRTVVVEREVQPPALVSSPVDFDDADDLDATIPAAPARRVDAEPLPAIYKPRPTPLAPSRPPVVEGSIAPSRVIDEQAASVSRAARRISAWTLSAVAGACVVSVSGLIALAFSVFA